MTWNIEGLRRNAHNLHFFLSKYKPDLVFLSEPQIFACDVDHTMDIFSDYKYYPNLPDDFDCNLPFERQQPKGGTLAMWHSSIDKFVTVSDPPSSSVLPLIIRLPEAEPSCHIGVYMPTAGLEDQFIVSLSHLESSLLHVKEIVGEDTAFFVRGDMNASEKNAHRFNLILNMLEKFQMKRVAIS